MSDSPREFAPKQVTDADLHEVVVLDDQNLLGRFEAAGEESLKMGEIVSPILLADLTETFEEEFGDTDARLSFVEVEIRRNRHGSVLAFVDRDRATRLLEDHRGVLHALYDLVDRRHGTDGDVVARIVVDEDAPVVDEFEISSERFRRNLEADRALSIVEDVRYHAGERQLIADGGRDQSSDEIDHRADVVLSKLNVGLGVRIIDQWASKEHYLFAGPHGRLEHVSYSETLDQWKRGLYQVDEVLRDRLVSAIDGHPQFAGWSYVRREQLGEPEPVVIDISEPARCTLCDGRFPSGNAFGWHLANVHQIDTEDKMEFAVPEPENQHTLNKWAGGSA